MLQGISTKKYHIDVHLFLIPIPLKTSWIMYLL